MFPPGDFARLTWTLQHAGVVTVVSHDLARKVRLLVDRVDKVEVIPNVVDPETFSPGRAEPSLRSALKIATAEVILGFCGELRYKKGLPFLLSLAEGAGGSTGLPARDRRNSPSGGERMSTLATPFGRAEDLLPAASTRPRRRWAPTPDSAT